MLYLVVYDIRDDRIRNEIREFLRDWGGEWIQRSAFFMELTAEELQRLKRRLSEIITSTEADILIVPVCRTDLEKMIHISTKDRAVEKHAKDLIF